MEAKPLRLLGLAKRAGQLVCGMDAVKKAAGRAQLLLLAGDAGHSAQREAERFGKPLMVLPYNKEELGRAAGRETCAVAAVLNQEFSRGIIEALNGGT